ncbi:MAG TPA: RDD family protein [Nocardioides sp.]|nr:RDD family protein [Nocardioides sp.]
MPATTPAAAVPDAPWIRRMLALFVDWLICTLVVAAFVGPSAIPFVTLFTHDNPDPSSTSWVTIAFVCESTVMTWLGGGSIGKLLTGLCVIPADGRLRRLHPAKIMLRQILILLVIPPLVFRNDGRGLHDLAAGTSTVTFATMRGLMGARGR